MTVGDESVVHDVRRRFGRKPPAARTALRMRPVDVATTNRAIEAQEGARHRARRTGGGRAVGICWSDLPGAQLLGDLGNP